jgi:hypothetical protein
MSGHVLEFGGQYLKSLYTATMRGHMELSLYAIDCSPRPIGRRRLKSKKYVLDQDIRYVHIRRLFALGLLGFGLQWIHVQYRKSFQHECMWSSQDQFDMYHRHFSITSYPAEDMAA